MTFDKFIAELEDILDEVDDIELTEELEELNATLEDVLFMLSEADEDEDDYGEDIEAAIDELMDISIGYKNIPETSAFGDKISAIATRMVMVLKNS